MTNLQYHIENSGVSIDKLAQRTNLSMDRLRDIIENKVEPSLREINSIAKAIKVSIDFILADQKDISDVSVLFRNTSSTKKDIYNSEKFSYYISNDFLLIDKENYKVGNLFSLLPNVPNSYEGAVSLANKFRDIYLNGDDIAPFLNLPSLLASKLNCIIHVVDLGVDGASAIVKGVPFIFVSPRFAPRMLFTLAHELGHLLSHHRNSNDFAVYDKEINALKNRSLQESFANTFASHLLLPDKGVGITLQKLGEYLQIPIQEVGDIWIMHLARIYGVSFEVAAKRCEDLELLPRGGAASLYEKVKKEHTSPEKRAEELGLPSRPQINFPRVSPSLISYAVNKIAKGDISIGKASEILSIPISEIISNHEYDLKL